ncbi:Uncharacterized protein dnm_025220 [Desulfonema magnum]|uniref:Uncharacterized protein n=1 Tax=Desulfonema magnum TaxID=45655 RepID=A0A975BJX0_9BACT|nr:Uncharacterized protein dnm_025220 [Desulfonema magnum]
MRKSFLIISNFRVDSDKEKFFAIFFHNNHAPELQQRYESFRVFPATLHLTLS